MRPVGKHKYKWELDIESDPNKMGNDAWGLVRSAQKTSNGIILIGNEASGFFKYISAPTKWQYNCKARAVV
jgi:hypothetical protein